VTDIVGALVLALIRVLAPLAGEQREAVAELLTWLLRQENAADLAEDA
jgi:hypothetical protein